MKKLSFKFVLLFAFLLPSIVFASRSRVLVMGSGDPTGLFFQPNGNGGSYYYKTAYNVFIHPALLLENDDQLLVEKSDFPGTAAQGAAIKSVGDLKLGLFLGRQADAVNFQNAAAMRQVELFGAYSFGFMDAGLGLSYFGRKQPDKRDDRNLKLRLGTIFNVSNFTIEPFGFVTITGVEETAPPDRYGHYDYQIALRSVIAEEYYVTTGYRRTWRRHKTVSTNVATEDVFGLGIAHNQMIDAKTRLIYGTGFWRHTSNRKNIVPIHLSAEYDILSWLTARAGLEYHAYNVERSSSAGDNTSGRFGLTAKKERFSFDWVIGSNSNNYATAAALTEQTSQADSQSFGFDSGFFTAAALTFKL